MTPKCKEYLSKKKKLINPKHQNQIILSSKTKSLINISNKLRIKSHNFEHWLNVRSHIRLIKHQFGWKTSSSAEMKVNGKNEKESKCRTNSYWDLSWSEGEEELDSRMCFRARAKSGELEIWKSSHCSIDSTNSNTTVQTA